jgi:hypothetical protein
MQETGSLERKTESRCRQCGKVFVRYVYEKVVRCGECRKANRMTASSATDGVEENPLQDARLPLGFRV